MSNGILDSERFRKLEGEVGRLNDAVAELDQAQRRGIMAMEIIDRDHHRRLDHMDDMWRGHKHRLNELEHRVAILGVSLVMMGLILMLGQCT